MVQTGDGPLGFVYGQPTGKKKMRAQELKNGRYLEVGQVLSATKPRIKPILSALSCLRVMAIDRCPNVDFMLSRRVKFFCRFCLRGS